MGTNQKSPFCVEPTYFSQPNLFYIFDIKIKSIMLFSKSFKFTVKKYEHSDNVYNKYPTFLLLSFPFLSLELKDILPQPTLMGGFKYFLRMNLYAFDKNNYFQTRSLIKTKLTSTISNFYHFKLIFNSYIIQYITIKLLRQYTLCIPDSLQWQAIISIT